MSRLFYDPETARPYIGLRMSSHQLAAVDDARLALRLSRSEFVRQAVTEYLERTAHLQQLQTFTK